MRQCICQICVCGRHHCNHRSDRTPYAKDDDHALVTEHKDSYRGCYQPREPLVIPHEEGCWKGDEPQVTQSTTKRDFGPISFLKRHLVKPTKCLEIPKGKMDCDTTYKHDFKPRCAEKNAPFKMKDNRDVMPGTAPVELDGHTTYGTSYMPKITLPREPVKAQGCTLTELGKPFYGDTETRRCYPPHLLSNREQVHPPACQISFEGDFYDKTTHRMDYPAKQQAKRKPLKILSKWMLNSGKFQGETTHAHDYKVRGDAERTEVRIPKGEIEGFHGYFDGTSNYKKDFMPHIVGPRCFPKWHPMFRKREHCDAPMAHQTTYKMAFEPPPEDQAPSKIKPLNNLTIPSDPMETLTTNMRDFRCRGVMEMVKSCKPDSSFKKPEGKFDGLTTTNTDFTPKCVPRSKGSKMPDNLGKEEGRMEDLTTFMKDFQGMYLDCPAKYIKMFGKDALPGFKFEKTVKGHDFFKLKRAKQKKSSKK